MQISREHIKTLESMESFRKRLTQVASFITSGIETDEVDAELKRETDLYKRDIREADIKLKRPNLSVEEKIGHIRTFGIMSWTGGPAISKFACKYLLQHLVLLGEPRQPLKLRIALLNSIVEISWLNDEIKERLVGNNVLKTVFDILEEDRDGVLELQRWAVYTLLCLATGSYVVQSAMLQLTRFEPKIWKMTIKSWPTWKSNPATKLIQLLNIKEEDTDSSDDEDKVAAFWWSQFREAKKYESTKNIAITRILFWFMFSYERRELIVL